MTPCTRCRSPYSPVGACHTDSGLCPQCSPLTNSQILSALRGRGPRTAADVATDWNRSDAEARAGLERMRRAGFVNRMACGCCYVLAGAQTEAA